MTKALAAGVGRRDDYPPRQAPSEPSGKWQVEVHGGVTLPTNPRDGTVTLPGPGSVFTTATGATVPAPSSRRESSWYFGAGAVLFNQAATVLAQLPGQMTALLGRLLGERGHSGSVGLSLTCTLSRPLSAEFSLDYNMARLEIPETNRDAIDATRPSFVPAFDGLIRFNPNRVLNSVTSTSALEGEGGRQVVTSGTLIVNLRTTADVIPYAAVGVGVIATTGKIPTATLAARCVAGASRS